MKTYGIIQAYTRILGLQKSVFLGIEFSIHDKDGPSKVDGIFKDSTSFELIHSFKEGSSINIKSEEEGISHAQLYGKTSSLKITC